jgi:lipopolysaccharide export system protein LptA
MSHLVRFWPLLLATTLTAAAQTTPARAPKPNDAASLDEAIRAVDRAKKQAVPTPSPAVRPTAEKPVPPAKPVKSAKPVPTVPPAKPATPVKPAKITQAAPPTPKPKADVAPKTETPSKTETPPKAVTAPKADVTPKAEPLPTLEPEASVADAASDSGAGGKPKAKPKSELAATQTQISGLEDAILDNARNTITFRKNVVVDRPDLKIWCDQLEILLNRSPAKAAPSDKAGGAADESDALGANTIKTATASSGDGGLVVVWRKTLTGDVVAVGRRAVYTATDGTFTITGMPEVLRDMTLHFHSPGEADKLVLYKNGSARGSKRTDLNLSLVKAREVRQRMFSHVPGRRPPEATEASQESSSSTAPVGPLPPPPGAGSTPPSSIPN